VSQLGFAAPSGQPCLFHARLSVNVASYDLLARCVARSLASSRTHLSSIGKSAAWTPPSLSGLTRSCIDTPLARRWSLCCTVQAHAMCVELEMVLRVCFLHDFLRMISERCDTTSGTLLDERICNEVLLTLFYNAELR
jgi:hypothetical protein